MDSVPRPACRIHGWRRAVPAGLFAAMVLAGCIGPFAPERRHAVADAEALAAAVAGWVEQHGTLPRITVSAEEGPGGHYLWGDAFLVEDIEVPRATPEAVTYTLAGTVDGWCVEVAYHPPGSFFDAAPTSWVSVPGSGAEVGRIRNEQCASELGLHLSAPWYASELTDGTALTAYAVPAGTCLAHPFLDDSPSGQVDLTGEVEVRDCAGPHVAEVFHAGELEEAPFEVERLWLQAAAACEESFASYVGVAAHNLSFFAFQSFAPAEEAWNTGDRRFSCVLYPETEHYQIYGSARDSWR
jgi:hypothetical protein